MAKGESGRVVIEIDPMVKARLYELLSLREVTLKQWFMDRVKAELESGEQMQLNFGWTDTKEHRP